MIQTKYNLDFNLTSKLLPDADFVLQRKTPL